MTGDHSNNKNMKTSPYAECNGELYIKAKCAGMDFLCLIIDGITITHLGRSKVPWLSIDSAIQWHEKEIEATKGDWDRGVLDVLIETKRKFESEKIPTTGPSENIQK